MTDTPDKPPKIARKFEAKEGRNLRIGDHLWRKILKLAADSGMTGSEWVRLILEQHLMRRETDDRTASRLATLELRMFQVESDIRSRAETTISQDIRVTAEKPPPPAPPPRPSTELYDERGGP